MKLKNLILLLNIVIILFSCKKYKYPESTFKGDPSTPSNCPFFGNITKYSVNGIDSLSLLDHYIDSAYSISKVGRNYKISLSQCDFSNLTMRGNYVEIFYGWGIGDMASLQYEFSKDKKSIKIKFQNNLHSIHKNLFIDNNLQWKIIRLTPDDCNTPLI